MITRRRFIQGAAVSLAFTVPGLSVASEAGPKKKFVLVILRGGLDGLAAVAPYGDSDYSQSRGALALKEPGADHGVLNLDGFFGFHPSLQNLHGFYLGGDLIAIHGSAPPYAKRSHFDAQNILETGVFPAYAASDGWLYRALAGLRGQSDSEHIAMSIGPAVPMVLRGDHPVGSWTPDNLPEPDDDTMARVMELYSHDQFLGPNLASMMQTESMAGNMSSSGRGPEALGQLAAAATRFLTHADGPEIVVLEAGGWDTHANQGAAVGPLANRLAQLDKVLGNMRTGLGDVWAQTAILVVTEFGRTVAMNGTRGTDHGVGGAAFLLGGAVKGKRVVADWPGLGKGRLYQGRDLVASIDQRSLFKHVLVDHLGAAPGFVDERVFPGTNTLAAIPELFR